MRDIKPNLNLKSIVKDLKRVAKKLQKYLVIIFALALVITYSFLVLKISNAAQDEPSQADIDQQLGTIKRLKIDESSIAKIQQLEDQNVEVQALFETARNNPFQQ